MDEDFKFLIELGMRSLAVHYKDNYEQIMDQLKEVGWTYGQPEVFELTKEMPVNQGKLGEGNYVEAANILGCIITYGADMWNYIKESALAINNNDSVYAFIRAVAKDDLAPPEIAANPELAKDREYHVVEEKRPIWPPSLSTDDLYKIRDDYKDPNSHHRIG